jgi:uncharacterized protein with beta-barrel porin domain
MATSTPTSLAFTQVTTTRNGMPMPRLAMRIRHGTLERSVAFPGVSRTAQGSPNANEFLSTAETGYRLSAGEHTAVTPFAMFQGIVIGQNAFAESGAGAIDLHVGSQIDGCELTAFGLD